ncbi:MAG: hypothetical protein K0U40_02795 [Betaproteobacteria bacterium]|nr:hypothetical protein [Betaproteobacteria bacterium]
MAKIQLTAQTRSPKRRKPGFALLKVTGWHHNPDQTQMAIQRSEDEKHLGADGEWEPIPVWQSLENMAVSDDGVFEGDVGPALVDPIVNAPNNSYRVTLKSGSDTETRTMKIDGAVLASSASGSAPDSTSFAKGFILSDSDDVLSDVTESRVATPVEAQQEEQASESGNTAQEFSETDTIPDTASASSGNKIRRIILLVLLLLGLVLGAAWFFKWFPFAEQNSIAETSTVDHGLSDLELLQQFMETQPNTEAILTQATEWIQTKRCDAALRLLVHSGHKSEDARIALTYAKLYDPNLFQEGHCIDQSDKDTATYWYQKAAEAGSADAAELLENIK